MPISLSMQTCKHNIEITALAVFQFSHYLVKSGQLDLTPIHATPV